LRYKKFIFLFFFFGGFLYGVVTSPANAPKKSPTLTLEKLYFKIIF